jgi:hypothetical protein
VGVLVGDGGVDGASGVGLGVWVGVGVPSGVRVGVGAVVGVVKGDCDMLVGVASLVGEWVGVGVDVRDGAGVSVRVSATAVEGGVIVCVSLGVRKDAIPVNCGLALPQTYDDIEQHTQTKQYTKTIAA